MDNTSSALTSQNVRPKVKFIIEKLFRIYNKQAELVDFKFNNVQNMIFEQFISKPEITRGNIVKARQFGVSTLMMAWFLVECMSRYCRCVMLAHDKDHTEKLLRRAQLMLKHLKGELKPEITRMNDNEIGFQKTDASFYIGTAGSKTFGRSDVITHLHCSEIGFWKDPATLLSGLLQAIPYDTGITVKESTGNGWGTWHQKDFYNALAGTAKDIPIFLPWHIFPEYQSKNVTPSFSLTPEETVLQKEYSLTLPQFQWRRDKIAELNGDTVTFNQEYPAKVEDAFKLTGGALLNPKFTEVLGYVGTATEMRLEGHPKFGYHYAFGADSSGGTGNDDSAIIGLCLETNEQVYRWKDNRTDPVAFARIVANKAEWFNEAFLVPERNSHGISMISILREIYSPTSIYRKPAVGKSISSNNVEIPALQYGWNTTEASKDYMIGIGAQVLLEDVKIYDVLLYDQLLGFVEDAETGKILNLNEHDDLGMAFLLACIGLLKLKRRYANDLFETIETVERPKTIDTSKWRDSEGVAFARFEDMFQKKDSQNIWVMN